MVSADVLCGYSELSNTTYPVLSKTVFAIFMVFVPILLLNMLIAMMGNTYAHVIEQSEKEWMKQWAKIVVTLERAVSQSDAHKYLEEYSISLGPANDDPTVEQRGVMVIKSKSKTRAKQRKGAVANWKRVGKVTINELRKRGMTGEELRCLMWGRESINTPVKIKKSIIDPIVNNEVPNVSTCFGGALTAALDVMSFTYEIDTETANQPPNPNDFIENLPPPRQKQPVIKTVSTDQPGTAMFGALAQLTESKGFDHIKQNPTPVTPTEQPNSAQTGYSSISTAPAHSLINKLVQTQETISDPMRELVLLSMKRKTNEERIQELAVQAANIQNVEVVAPKSEITIPNLAGIFTGTETFIKKVEETVKKKSPLIDPSDSDSLENSILGKLSRTRRAISANIRNISARSKNANKKALNCSHSDSSFDSNININYEPMKQDDELEYATERMNMIKEELRQNMDNSDSDSIKPLFIVRALKKTTKCLEQQVSSETPSLECEEEPQKHKRKSRRRSKTAKTNRVTPAVDVTQRRNYSAEKEMEKVPETPPDPILPWSVEGISNMNKLLAWEDAINSE